MSFLYFIFICFSLFLLSLTFIPRILLRWLKKMMKNHYIKELGPFGAYVTISFASPSLQWNWSWKDKCMYIDINKPTIDIKPLLSKQSTKHKKEKKKDINQLLNHQSTNISTWQYKILNFILPYLFIKINNFEFNLQLNEEKINKIITVTLKKIEFNAILSQEYFRNQNKILLSLNMDIYDFHIHLYEKSEHLSTCLPIFSLSKLIFYSSLDINTLFYPGEKI